MTDQLECKYHDLRPDATIEWAGCGCCSGRDNILDEDDDLISLDEYVSYLNQQLAIALKIRDAQAEGS